MYYVPADQASSTGTISLWGVGESLGSTAVGWYGQLYHVDGTSTPADAVRWLVTTEASTGQDGFVEQADVSASCEGSTPTTKPTYTPKPTTTFAPTPERVEANSAAQLQIAVDNLVSDQTIVTKCDNSGPFYLTAGTHYDDDGNSMWVGMLVAANLQNTAIVADSDSPCTISGDDSFQLM